MNHQRHSDHMFARADRKVKPGRRMGRDIAKFVVGILVLVCCMLFVVYKRSSVVDLGYSITELRHQNAQLRQEQIRLRSEKARLERPGRILNQAFDLGLRPLPKGDRYEVVYTQAPLPDQHEEREQYENLVARLNVEP